MLKESECNKCHKKTQVALVIPIEDSDPDPTGMPAYVWNGDDMEYVHDLCNECACELNNNHKGAMGFSGIRGDWDFNYV